MKRISIFIFVAVLLTTTPVALAGFFNGKTPFYTVKTKHFAIHYSEGLSLIATEVQTLAEEVHDRLTARLQWVPKTRTHIVLTDKSDVANGIATVMPQNHILIFTAIPEAGSSLDDYRHYYEFLITHEYTHILHIDQHHRWASPLRYVMGKIVAPNAATPRWMREGMAVYEESLLDKNFGRTNSPQTDMIIRTAVYEDKFPRIDQITGITQHFPTGLGAYYFGGAFYKWLTKNYGEDRLYQYQKEYASSLLFFGLNNKARRVYGKSFYKLWDEFRRDMKQGADEKKQELEVLGLTELESVIQNKDTQFYYTPRPSGGFAYYETSLDKAPRIFLSLPNEKKPREIKRQLFGQMSFDRHGKYLTFGSLTGIEKKESHSEVFYYNIEKKTLYRVFVGKNAQTAWHVRDPDFSSVDGGSRWLVMVRNSLHTDQLYIFDIKERQGYFITNEPAKTQLSNPRFSPDGSQIVVSRKDPETGQRDIVIYSRTGKRLKTVTDDVASDLYPVFSNDGKRVYFSSYRTGVANIFEYNLRENSLRQRTNVLTGVFQPMPSLDGQEVYVQHYGGENSSIKKFHDLTYNAHLFSKSIKNRKKLKSQKNETQDGMTPSTYKNELAGMPSEIKIQEVHPQGSKKYSPFPQIFAPGYMIPNILIIENGVQGSLTLGKQDPLYRHLWSGSVDYRSDAKFLGGSAMYTYTRYDPTFYIGGIRYPVDWGTINTTRFFEERWRGYAGMGYGWGNQSWNFTYFYERRLAFTNLTGVTFTNMKPYAGVSWRYQISNFKQFPDSISKENGYLFKVGSDWTNSVLGSHGVNEEVVAFGDTRFFIEMPWSDHHVLALRAALGWSWGDQQQFGVFRLGGPFGEGVGSVPISPRVMPLRGLPGITYGGDQVAMFSGEYRLPISTNVNTGIGTWPFFLDKIYMVFFADAGDIRFRTDTAELFSRFLLSVGSELKGDFVIGYGLPITWRLGYGIILTNRSRLGTLTDSLTGMSVKNGTAYFQVGTSF